MIAVALKGLAGRKVRALLTALAIVIGISMVSGTYILTDTMQKTFDGLFAASYDETDAVIAGKEIVEKSLSGSATVDGRRSNASTGSSETTCRVTVIGPIRPSRRSGTDDGSRSRSTVARCSTNWGERASSVPSAATAIESPSKTSSSCPPTWLQ